MFKITEKQKKLLNFIYVFLNKYGYSPSIREISKGLGLSSNSSVQAMLIKLEEKNLIKRKNGAARSISLTDKYISAVEPGIPVIGRVSAGLPVESDENIESYITADSFISHCKNGFFLRVKGYSMKDKGILNNDYAFIIPQKTLNNGQIGVFRLNNEITLKTFKIENNIVYLIPANEEFNTIKVSPEDEFEVIGIFTMLLRFNEKGYERILF